MEQTFEIKQVYTYKMVSEFFRYGLRKITRAYLIVAGLMLVIYLLASLGGGSYWEMAVTCAVLMVACHFLPNLVAWIHLRERKRKNGGQLPTGQICFGEEIEDTSPGQRLILSYDRIEKIVHLKHSYVLMIDKRTGILLDTNSFTKGSFPELKQLLREKCPKLLIPE